MANIRIWALVLVLFILLNCALVQAANVEQLLSREKRLFFGCAKMGKKCSFYFGKSCCGGLVCHTSYKKCVSKNAATNWLDDRNGK